MVNLTLLLQFQLVKELKERNNMFDSRTEVKMQKPILSDAVYVVN